MNVISAIRDALVEKIWEGTTTVLALDLVRAARDPQTMSYFHSVCIILYVFIPILTIDTSLPLQWAKKTISGCPQKLETQLQTPLQLLKSGLDELSTAYQAPIPVLLPRPALMLFGYIVSSLYLLEHAIWSHSNKEPGNETDIEVLRRWTVEAGLLKTIDEVKTARTAGSERVAMDLEMVYGKRAMARL